MDSPTDVKALATYGADKSERDGEMEIEGEHGLVGS